MSLAQKLLDESIVVDTHLDLLFDIAGKHEMGRKNVIIEDYLESFRAGKVDVIVSSTSEMINEIFKSFKAERPTIGEPLDSILLILSYQKVLCSLI